MIVKSESRSSAAVSPNFSFLIEYDDLLFRCAARAERFLFDDPNTSLYKLRQFELTMAQTGRNSTGGLLRLSRRKSV